MYIVAEIPVENKQLIFVLCNAFVLYMVTQITMQALPLGMMWSRDGYALTMSPLCPLELIEAEWHIYTIDPSNKSHNASDKYPTMHHFATEMCTQVHISVTKCCIVGYGTDAF